MKPIAFRILNREYQVNCPTGCEEQLFEAARYLDEKIREIRSHGRVIGLERMAIMAALNITHELLTQKNQHNTDSDHIQKNIERIQNKVEQALREPEMA